MYLILAARDSHHKKNTGKRINGDFVIMNLIIQRVKIILQETIMLKKKLNLVMMNIIMRILKIRDLTLKSIIKSSIRIEL